MSTVCKSSVGRRRGLLAGVRVLMTMLAGAGPVPAVVLVVAADEGWMPQSAEHLDALDALGVEHGLLAR